MADTGATSGISENIDRDAMEAFTNPTNADAQSDSYANIDMNAQAYTDWLRTTQFGFNIEGTIVGIHVEIDHYGEAGNIEEHSCRLVLGGVIQGDEKMTLSNDIPLVDTDAYESYGGVDDDWNAGLSQSDINNATFGVQVSYWNDHNVQDRNIYVDHVRMTVYYTPPGGEAEEIESHSKLINKHLNPLINERMN